MGEVKPDQKPGDGTPPCGLTLVRQEHPDGCGIATAAMLLGIPYAAALDEFGEEARTRLDRGKGVNEFMLEQLLKRRGFALLTIYSTFDDGRQQRATWPPEPLADRHIVLSHNQAGTYHFSVLAGDGTVFDPCHGLYRLADYHCVCNLTAVIPVHRMGRSA